MEPKEKREALLVLQPKNLKVAMKPIEEEEMLVEENNLEVERLECPLQFFISVKHQDTRLMISLGIFILQEGRREKPMLLKELRLVLLNLQLEVMFK